MFVRRDHTTIVSVLLSTHDRRILLGNHKIANYVSWRHIDLPIVSIAFGFEGHTQLEGILNKLLNILLTHS